jgi:hypothetical protein
MGVFEKRIVVVAVKVKQSGVLRQVRSVRLGLGDHLFTHDVAVNGHGKSAWT